MTVPGRGYRLIEIEPQAAIGDTDDRPGPALPGKPSIAVLPFQNLSADPEQEYFADGIVEEIITALSRFSGLFVIARNSSFTYKGCAVDVKQVGRELGVRYVLEGSVRKSANLAAYGMATWCYVQRKADRWMNELSREVAETFEACPKGSELWQAGRVALSRAGHALAYVTCDLESGVIFVERALALNPNLASAWFARACNGISLGQPEKAVQDLPTSCD